MSEICEQCWPGVLDAGEVLPGVRLARLGARWALVVSPYHISDDVLGFDVPPKPDPLDGMTDDEVNAAPNADIYWADDALPAMKPLAGKLGLVGSHEVVAAALTEGWDQSEHGYLDVWLYNRIGEMVVEHAG